MEIINWVEREAQKLCGQSPYYIVRVDRYGSRSLSIHLDPSRSITWSLVTLSSGQPMTFRHACALRPLQVTCDRNTCLEDFHGWLYENPPKEKLNIGSGPKQVFGTCCQPVTCGHLLLPHVTRSDNRPSTWLNFLNSPTFLLHMAIRIGDIPHLLVDKTWSYSPIPCLRIEMNLVLYGN